MAPTPRRHWLGYGVAVVSALVALLLSLALRDVIRGAPFLLFFPAVMLSGWVGGLGPGLVATLCSFLLSWYFFVGVERSFAIASNVDALRLALFFLEALFITALNAAFHRWRKRAIAARAGETQAEQRYRAFVQNSSEAIWRFECERPIPISLPADEQIDRMYADAYLAECNEAVARMYGFATAAEMVGKRLGEFMPRESQANVDYLRAFVHSGYRLSDAESEERDREGRTIHLVNNLVGVVEDGYLVRAWGTQRDVTGHREAEQIRRRAGEMVHVVTDALPSLIAFIDRDERYVFANLAYEAWRGQPREQIVGRRVRDVLGESAWGSIRHHVERALAGETVRYETRIMYPRAGMRDIDVTYVPQRGPDGRVEGFASLVHDVTDSRRSDTRGRFLSEAAALLGASLDYEATLQRLARLAVPALADWCFVDARDAAGGLRRVAVAHADPEQERRVTELRRRYPHRAGDPGAMTAMTTLKPQMVEDIGEDYLRAVAHDEEHLDALRALGLKSGMVVPLIARGRPLGAITFLTAESNRRFGPTDLTFAEDLARRAALAIDNASLYHEAQAANRTKDEFLSTLSHELRTPLNAILGWSQLLGGGQRTEEGELEHGLEAIERNARAQAQLIEDLLDISRIITGKLRLDVRPIELAPVVEAAIESVRPAANAREIRLQIVLDPKAGPVSGDAGRLQQVVWNLLSNAIKFTPRGGRVSVRLERVNSHVEIAVADNGEGIDPAVLPHIFDRFHQADATTTRKHGGLGLGLSIVRHLVELHGGTVHAESAGANQGALLVVKLPLAVVRKTDEPRVHPTATAEAPAPPPTALGLEGVRVLIVDDEPDARDLLSHVLRRSRADVEAVDSAAAALESIRRAPPDVLLSDIGMPGEDGYTLIQKVRELEEQTGLGKIPAVALTAFARAEDRRRALMAGFQMHVPKPVEPAELTAVVANLAGRT